MNLQKRSMIFYKEWMDAVMGLHDDDQLDALYALLDYGLSGQRPEDLPANIDAVLDFAEEKIQRDHKRFLAYIHKLNYEKANIQGNLHRAGDTV